MSKSSRRLTPAQNVVLAFYAAHRVAAMRFEGRWLWAKEIRANPSVALRFIHDRANDPYPENDRDARLLRAWMQADQGSPRQ